jgi:uncharacterized protein YqgC (DUF456 family)
MENVTIPLTIFLMVIGLFLAFVPLVPATALQWAIAMIFAAADGFHRVTVPAAVIITLLMLAGSTSGIWLPYFGMKGKGVSCIGLTAFMIGCMVGVLIPIPIIGSMIGGIIAVVVVEFARVGTWRAAVQGGVAATRVMILGFVFEFVFSLAIFLTFLISLATTG